MHRTAAAFLMLLVLLMTAIGQSQPSQSSRQMTVGDVVRHVRWESAFRATRIAPNYMISSVAGLNPVVSRSDTTNSSDKKAEPSAFCAWPDIWKLDDSSGVCADFRRGFLYLKTGIRFTEAAGGRCACVLIGIAF
jgi:hypothetical protein